MQILLNHVVLGDLTSAAIAEAIAASSTGTTTVSSLVADLDVTEDGDIMVTPAGSSVAATVVVADVETCVGTVHVIDRVLVPSMVVSPDTTAGATDTAVAPLSDLEDTAAPMSADAFAPLSVEVCSRLHG